MKMLLDFREYLIVIMSFETYTINVKEPNFLN